MAKENDSNKSNVNKQDSDSGVSKNNATSESTVKENESNKPEENISNNNIAESKPAKDKENEKEPKKETDNKASDNNEEKVSITIVKGDSSYLAAKKLQNAELVDSAAKFDEYLCKNGYDKYLVIGSYNIPKNASYKEIADMITSKH